MSTLIAWNPRRGRSRSNPFPAASTKRSSFTNRVRPSSVKPRLVETRYRSRQVVCGSVECGADLPSGPELMHETGLAQGDLLLVRSVEPASTLGAAAGGDQIDLLVVADSAKAESHAFGEHPDLNEIRRGVGRRSHQ